jgi:biotin carboxyl carrier protein
VTDNPDLTPEDVEEILRLVDESDVEELELETPRFTIRWRRGDTPPPASERGRPADGLVEVTSPSVGTFYRSPAPGEKPFVEVGSPVEPGTQVCIIEVMKLMHAVVAGTSGTIVEVCRADARAVQYGDVLFRIERR